MTFLKSVGAFVCLSLLFTLSAFATTVPLTGTIQLPDGSRLNGAVRFYLSYSAARDTTNNNITVASRVQFPVQNGTLPSTAKIVPNDVLQPANTFYTVQYLTASGGLVAQNNFIVQNGAGFDLGTATPTPVTTSNLSFSNFTGLTQVTTKNLNNVRKCDLFAGATADVKLAACIADLPSTGGTADARGLEGNQTVNSNFFTGVTKPVTVLLGCGTYSIAAILTPPSQSKLIGNGRCSVLSFVDDGTATSRQIQIPSGTSDVLIENVTVTSTAVSRTGVYGLIRIESASRVSVLNSTFLTSPATSIWMMNGTDILLQGNTAISPFADCIHVSRQSIRVRIIGNTLTACHDDAIGLISYTDNPSAWTDNQDITVSANVINNVTVGRGIAVYGGDGIAITGNTLSDIDQSGIIVSAAPGALSSSTTHFPKHITVANNTIRNAGRSFGSGQGSCIYVNPARLVSLNGNAIDTCGQDGITLAGVTKDIVIQGNTISRPTARGISVDATASTDARTITELFTNLGEAGIVTALSAEITIANNIVRIPVAEGIYASMPASDFLLGMTVTGNTIVDSAAATDGMQFSRVSRLSVSGNYVNNCTNGIRFAAADHFTATGNTVTNNTAGGILLVGATDGTVSGNVATDDVIGIFVDGTSSDNSVVNNFFLGNATTDLQDSGTRTTKANHTGTADATFTIGSLGITDLNGTLSTTFTNGGGSAMPANIEKMLTISVGGTTYKIPLVKP